MLHRIVFFPPHGIVFYFSFLCALWSTTLSEKKKSSLWSNVLNLCHYHIYMKTKVQLLLERQIAQAPANSVLSPLAPCPSQTSSLTLSSFWNQENRESCCYWKAICWKLSFPWTLPVRIFWSPSQIKAKHPTSSAEPAQETFAGKGLKWMDVSPWGIFKYVYICFPNRHKYLHCAYQ